MEMYKANHTRSSGLASLRPVDSLCDPRETHPMNFMSTFVGENGYVNAKEFEDSDFHITVIAIR